MAKRDITTSGGLPIWMGGGLRLITPKKDKKIIKVAHAKSNSETAVHPVTIFGEYDCLKWIYTTSNNAVMGTKTSSMPDTKPMFAGNRLRKYAKIKKMPPIRYTCVITSKDRGVLSKKLLNVFTCNEAITINAAGVSANVPNSIKPITSLLCQLGRPAKKENKPDINAWLIFFGSQR